MADLYLDHGVYGAYSATPTWGTPQEGDGKASGTGSCAIGSIVFTQGHSSGSLGIFGATVTPSTSASADAAANNAATAINASTVAINSTFGAGRTPQLRNVVWARGPAGGAPSGTCQIMTRVAAASLNDAGSTSITQSGFNGTVPTLNQFAGGASGAFGYALNSATVWPQSFAIASYGAFDDSTLVGTIDAGDTVHVRTKRSGSNITATASGGSSISITLPTGPATAPVKFIADAGVVWGGDAGVFTLFWSATSDISIYGNTMDHSRSVILRGVPTGEITRNFVIRYDSGYSRPRFGLPGNSRVVDVHIVKGTTGISTMAAHFGFGGTRDTPNLTHPFGPVIYKGTVFENEAPNVGGLLAARAYIGSDVLFDECPFVMNATLPITDGLLTYDLITSAEAGAVHWTFRNCKGIGYVVGSGLGTVYRPGAPGAVVSQARTLIFEDNDFGNMTIADFGMVGVLSPTFTANNVSDARMNPDITHRAVITSRSPGRRYYFETMSHTIEWNPTLTYPLLRAQLPEAYSGGEDRWVYRLSTAPADTQVFNRTNPMRVTRLSKFNTLNTGIRTLTLEFLVDSQIDTGGAPLQKSEFVIEVSYTDASGVAHTERSFNIDTDTDGNATTSTANWSADQYDVAGVAHYYNKLKVSLTTTNAIKANSEVFIDVLVGKPGLTANDWYFIDPEVAVS